MFLPTPLIQIIEMSRLRFIQQTFSKHFIIIVSTDGKRVLIMREQLKVCMETIEKVLKQEIYGLYKPILIVN